MKSSRSPTHLWACLLACLHPLGSCARSLGIDIPESLLSAPESSPDAALVLESTSIFGEGPVGGERVPGLVPMELRDVRVHLLADAGISATTEHLHFRAPGSDIQATFKFPLPPRAAVYRFEASIGDHIIRTEVQEKAEAKATYERAVRQGHSAILMEQASKSNMYTVNLGNLAAHETCVVEISYIQVLSSVANTLEWTHTSTWVPPFTGSQRDAVHMDEIQQTTPRIETRVSYLLAYEVCISSGAEIKSLDSVERIQVLSGNDMKGDVCQRVVKLSSEVSDPGRDFTLLVEVDSSTEPSVALQQTKRGGATKTVGLASFPISSFDASQAKGANSDSETTSLQASNGGPLDWIFQAFSHSERETSGQSHVGQSQAAQLKQDLYLVADCSGSMEGEPIQFAREAALYVVRDLPPSVGVKFQVMCFGSNFIKMHHNSEDYNEETEKMAVSWINNNIGRNLGGTQMLDVLEHIYRQPIPKDYERQIIFITDGGVSSSEERYITRLIAESPQAPRTTVYTLGIGYGVHRGLLEDMAQLSGGTTQYVQSSADITKSCSFLRQCALSVGMLMEPKLKARSCKLKTVPLQPPPRLFEGQTLRVLFEVTHADPGASLELDAVRRDGTPVKMTVPILSSEGEDRTSKEGTSRVVEGDELAGD
ncbi:hypothetical protein DUNSADRAFT_12096 [Dunaliella salina]|uniref:Uncharacterized protein n=1 Tax=Dunaliella salina TaxID=3046 RepID=A0ABQ7H459_DUNSA|nr:hypothetical protein DUNSADRAFT_12096 [Dunaliella salina]|eukprot:KAF5841639.1 hypothetical protein DUNSADRAFT_12096 [Dunaliella salina]